ncbi:MAG: hypothetical protein H7Y42_16130 [Chitinophagaceae bacterium]|nr:hypothetical protein [Chitinophagaceae bacterium]
MRNDRIIVAVTASFENKEELLHTLKKYAQRTDDQFAYWDEFAFTTEIPGECDAVLVLNSPGSPLETLCESNKVIAFMMEPGIRSEHPWMFRMLDQYNEVYTPVPASRNTIPSHGFLGWYFKQDYNWLKTLPIPVKTKQVSCISSNLSQLPGHRLRLDFLAQVKARFPQIDIFGKGTNYLADKMEGLLPYRYSIAIENSSKDDYFTEKINDCFLAYTIPVYYGCRNIDRYFPKRSFIRIDLNSQASALQKIQEILATDDWQDRLEAVQEARELVLHKYQPLAGAANIFRSMKEPAPKKNISLLPVRKNIVDSLKSFMRRWTHA